MERRARFSIRSEGSGAIHPSGTPETIRLRGSFLLFLFQGLPEGVPIYPYYIQPRTFFVFGWNDMPRRVFRTCPEEHLIGGFHIGGPFFSVAPVIRGDLIIFPRDLFPLLEPPQLLVRGNVQPEFEQDIVMLLQLLLKVIQLRISTLPILRLRQFFHPLHQHPAIP